MTTSEILQNIDRRLADIRREITALQQARIELVNGTRSAAPVQRSPRKRGRQRTRKTAVQGRRVQMVPAGVLERLLGQSDGLTTAALANQAGAEHDQVLTLLKELEAAGRVRRLGDRRATRWQRGTEEDAIAERAAELAARSQAKAATPTASS